MEVDKERFHVEQNTSFLHHYAAYIKRIEAFKTHLLSRLTPPISLSLSDVPVGIQVSLVGFIFIDENDKYPNIHNKTDEYRNGRQVYVEDQTGRARLIGEFPFKVTSGIVIGVTGKLNEEGNFEFVSMMLPEAKMAQDIEPKKLTIGFVSNLCVTDEDFDQKTGKQLLEQINCFDLCVFIGNVISSESGQVLGRTEEDWTEWLSVIDASSYEKFVDFFGQIRTMKLLIPGFGDPCERRFPIQPLSETLTKELVNCECTTNPASFSYRGIKILAMSGEIINAIDGDEMSFHEKHRMLLTWCHLAPSTPGKIPCYIDNSDPFAINQLPNLFVAGGSNHFKVSTVENCSVVSIPSYKKTRTIVGYDASTGNFVTYKFT